jgi:hypothetical protein
MAEHRVIIEHKKDGRRYSVPEKDPRATGEEPGWKVEGPEVPESFIATGIPAPKRPRTRPRAKAAAKVAGSHPGGAASVTEPVPGTDNDVAVEAEG